jgi:hypothetical protein
VGRLKQENHGSAYPLGIALAVHAIARNGPDAIMRVFAARKLTAPRTVRLPRALGLNLGEGARDESAFRINAAELARFLPRASPGGVYQKHCCDIPAIRRSNLA